MLTAGSHRIIMCHMPRQAASRACCGVTSASSNSIWLRLKAPELFCSENERRAPMHQRLAEVIGERERRIAAARAEAEASNGGQMTFRPQLDERSLRLAAGREAERAAAGGVARPKELAGGLAVYLCSLGLRGSLEV